MKYNSTVTLGQELGLTHYPDLKFFKIFPEAFAPEWGTEHAACFDLRACLIEGAQITVFQHDNSKHSNIVGWVGVLDGTKKIGLNIRPNERVMVPTGLKFNIPTGYSVRIHARSGLSLKSALVLANQEGVVDSDYVDPTYIVLVNNSSTILTIFHGDRLAQAEMMPDIAYSVLETVIEPTVKSNRTGGFGSTGV